MPSGRPTRNGLFYERARDTKLGKGEPHKVRVYEKLKRGIWVYNGLFGLTDSWFESDGTRKVLKFRLKVMLDLADSSEEHDQDIPHLRIIPSAIKLLVWKRDQGRCVKCGRSDNLHFDHVLPFSKGGTSLTAQNIQLLCSRHNLQKHDRIE